MPFNQLYHHTHSVISAGREGFFQAREGERWPSHPGGAEELPGGHGHAARQPHAEPHRQDGRPGADVFDILSAKWIQSNSKSPADMVTLTADGFLATRGGLKPNISGTGRRGGYKDTQCEKIAAWIASLDQLWINVQEMSSTVMENGRRRRKIRMQTKAVVVTIRAGDVEDR